MNQYTSRSRRGIGTLMLLTLLCARDVQAALPHDDWLSFDGQNDIATVPNSSTLSVSAQITVVEAWVPAGVDSVHEVAFTVDHQGRQRRTEAVHGRHGMQLRHARHGAMAGDLK
jgi:hypothetical protein